MRVLYVEDNEVNQALIARVMRARRNKVVFSEEGERALEILAEDGAIDLILLDIELAGSMSGLDVVRTLRARNDQRPVVAITAYAMMGDRERILESGCDQYLPKPLVIPDLLKLLDHYENVIAQAAEEPAISTGLKTVTPPPAAEATPAAPVNDVASAETTAPAPAAGPPPAPLDNDAPVEAVEPAPSAPAAPPAAESSTPASASDAPVATTVKSSPEVVPTPPASPDSAPEPVTNVPLKTPYWAVSAGEEPVEETRHEQR